MGECGGRVLVGSFRFVIFSFIRCVRRRAVCLHRLYGLRLAQACLLGAIGLWLDRAPPPAPHSHHTPSHRGIEKSKSHRVAHTGTATLRSDHQLAASGPSLLCPALCSLCPSPLPSLCTMAAAAVSNGSASSMGNAADFEYSLTCLGAGYVGGPTMVRLQQARTASGLSVLTQPLILLLLLSPLCCLCPSCAARPSSLSTVRTFA